MAVVALFVFVFTLIFVIWQPKGLSIGWTATFGAVLALLLHVVTFADVGAVIRIVWDATLTFVALIVISSVLEKSGFFEWAALKMAHAAQGDGRRVFVYIIVLGALVSAFFANDGAALILTPIVLEKVKLLRFDAKRMLPFIFASGFIADTTSIPLVISNLVNIVSADFFHIGFIRYALHMVLPEIVSFCASLSVLYLFFRKDIPKQFNPLDLPDPRDVIRSLRMFRLSWVILTVLLVGYVATELLHIPVSFVALCIAAVFVYTGWRYQVVQPVEICKEAPWSIVVFSVGMYVVVYGLQDVGLTTLLGHVLEDGMKQGFITGTLVTGLVSALLSSTMNNLPSVLIGALAIHATHSSGVIREAMVYANVIGCDLGPKITPLGSLATLLWLHVLGRQGIRITWGQYFRIGVVLTVPTLVLTLVGLSLSLQWFG